MTTIIRGNLVAQSAVHMGAGVGNHVADALLRRDSSNQPLIPGTAIAGALRSLLTRLGPRLDGKACLVLKEKDEEPAEMEPEPCRCGVCRLMGHVNPGAEGEEGTTTHASNLLVFNAHLLANTVPYLRDGVGIDRVTGAAARAGGVKFDQELLPAGAAFQLRLELRSENPADKQLLAAALAEWLAGRLWLGGNVARGLGAFRLEDVRVNEANLDLKQSLMTFLRSDSAWQQTDAQPADDWLQSHRPAQIHPWDETAGEARSWLEVRGRLLAQGLFLTNDATEAGLTGFDHTPLLRSWNEWDSPVLAGAGIRGVLRSHAGRLARTLATLNNPGGMNQEVAQNWFLAHCPACDPNARRPPEQMPLSLQPPLESCDSLVLHELGKDGNAWVDHDTLCLGCRLFGSTRWGSRLLVEDAPYVGEEPPVYKMRDFVAIDRFTGGGADRFKYDALALWQPAFSFRLFLENPELWELGWLSMVLRDLVEGRLSFGYGVNKGFGRMKLESISLAHGYLLSEDVPEGVAVAVGEQKGIYRTTTTDSFDKQPWAKLLAEGRAEFRKLIYEGKFERSPGMALPRDSYYQEVGGYWLPDLYPATVEDRQQ